MTYKEIVTSSATDTLGSKKSYQGRKKTTPWWTEEVMSEVKEKMRLFRIWTKRRRPEDRIEYELARNRAGTVKKKKRIECGKKSEKI